MRYCINQWRRWLWGIGSCVPLKFWKKMNLTVKLSKSYQRKSCIRPTFSELKTDPGQRRKGQMHVESLCIVHTGSPA